MCLGLIKEIDPDTLRAATESAEIIRDCLAMNTHAVRVIGDRMITSEGIVITSDEWPKLQPVLEGTNLDWPVNYLIAHGREGGFYTFDTTPESIASFVEFLLQLVPEVHRKALYIIKLSACESAVGFAEAVMVEAKKRGLRLVLLASPLFLYTLPRLDDDSTGILVDDPDSGSFKINYQKQFTTNADYENCMRRAVARGYLQYFPQCLHRLFLPMWMRDETESYCIFRDALSSLNEDADESMMMFVDSCCLRFLGWLRAEIIDRIFKAFRRPKSVRPPENLTLEGLEHYLITVYGPLVNQPLAPAEMILRLLDFADGETLSNLESTTARKRIALEKMKDESKRPNIERAIALDEFAIHDLHRWTVRHMWSDYLAIMDMMRKAAGFAQRNFCTLLRDLLLQNVSNKVGALEKYEKEAAVALEQLQMTLRSPKRLPSTVLLVEPFVGPFTKGGYRIFIDLEDLEARDILLKLATWKF